MSKSKKVLLWIIPITIIVSFFIYFKNAETPYKTIPSETLSKKQMILIAVDGMQIAQFNKLLSAGNLPNFNKFILNGGENSVASITGHENTSTAPGNAELLTGLNSSVTKITDNTCGTIIPKGLTIFERLYNFDSKIILGSIYGKESCYVPLSLLSNAKPIITWWQDSKTYEHKKYTTDTCTDSTDVTNKSLEFIQNNKNNNFYLLIYLGAPDCTGHTFGLPSLEYDKSIINVDEGLGILLNGLNSYNLKPEIIISGDHGWNSTSSNHSLNNEETANVALITKNHYLIGNKDENSKQCDITPTILNYFGMESSQFTDITQTGCASLMMIQ